MGEAVRRGKFDPVRTLLKTKSVIYITVKRIYGTSKTSCQVSNHRVCTQKGWELFISFPRRHTLGFRSTCGTSQQTALHLSCSLDCFHLAPRVSVGQATLQLRAPSLFSARCPRSGPFSLRAFIGPPCQPRGVITFDFSTYLTPDGNLRLLCFHRAVWQESQ